MIHSPVSFVKKRQTTGPQLAAALSDDCSQHFPLLGVTTNEDGKKHKDENKHFPILKIGLILAVSCNLVARSRV